MQAERRASAQGVPANGSQYDDMQFPEVTGENLVGQQLTFPRDFVKRTIVLVAFDLKARESLESWVPLIDRYVRDGTVDGRIFPVIPRSMRMMKGMILTTMRKTGPPPEARAATVPLFVDLDDFCAALEIAERSLLHVYVVDAGGAVLEHQTGAFSQRAGAAIEALITVQA